MNDYTTIPLKRARHDGWFKDQDGVYCTTVYAPVGMVNVAHYGDQVGLTTVAHGKLEQVLINNRISKAAAIKRALSFVNKLARSR